MSVTFVELYQRLQRIHAAIGKTFEVDLSKFRMRVEKKHKRRGKKGQIKIGFSPMGVLGQQDIENYAWAAIHNISIFFNHLMAWADNDETLTNEIRVVNEDSEALRILRALDNKEKHPKARGKKDNLKLGKVSRAIQFSRPGAAISIRMDGSIGEATGVAVIITADVLNAETGDKVGDLNTLLAQAISDWESFLSGKGLLE